ncbi:MAG: universal stress protein [Thermoleophilia bacterium]|nr:universal stress protein [Thermoleophilia bacterium]
MIGSLLVPIDSSIYARSATTHAVELGKLYQARLTGLYVLDVRYLEMPPYLDYSYTFEAVPPTLLPLDVLEKFRAKSERLLAEFREVGEKAGLEVETRTEEGVPSQVIADLGRSFDLVIMGKRGEHAKWGRDLLGSTAENVIRRADTPVLLVEEEARGLANLLLLFDGSGSASRALKLAADLAAHTGASLWVLTVDDDREHGLSVQEEARTYLEPLGLDVAYRLEEGRVTRVALALLEEQDCDLVVVGRQGHSALHHLILGSTAEHLMRAVERPVLLVP